MERGVTYRVYGDRGQFKRPMTHRWPASRMHGVTQTVRGLFVENVTRANPLFERLSRHAAP